MFWRRSKGMRRLIAFLGVLVCGGLTAAPPEVPATITAPAGKVKEIVVKSAAGKELAYKLVGGPAAFREMKGAGTERVFWLITETDEWSAIVWWTVGEGDSAVTEINGGGNKPKPPLPPGPGPAPGPAKSFHVVLVYESGTNPTPEQRAVLYGKDVEAWLTANCTGGTDGWRRRDKDSDGDADTTMASLWAAVKPKVTTTPCVAVERDGKVDIINVEASPAAMIQTLQKYKTGGK